MVSFTAGFLCPIPPARYQAWNPETISHILCHVGVMQDTIYCYRDAAVMHNVSLHILETLNRPPLPLPCNESVRHRKA